MTAHDIPQERDLPPGRLSQLKDELMAQIEHDIETERPAVPDGARRHRRRRAALAAAAALAVGFGVATALVARDDGTASANTATRTADGGILITIREAKDPEALQQRLVDLGVPAVVDFLESGFGCDHARSSDWVSNRQGEDLFSWYMEDPEMTESKYVLHPEVLDPGETVVIEFQIDEHGDDLAALATTRVSAGPVGPCVPVPNASIVDAEAGIAGG